MERNNHVLFPEGNRFKWKANVMMEDQAKEIEYLLKLLKEKEALLEAKEMQLRDKDKIIKLLEDRK